MDRALIFDQGERGIQLYFCQPHEATIKEDITLLRKRNLSEFSTCREITTKFLPIRDEEIQDIQKGRGAPQLFQGISPSDLLEKLKGNDYQQVTSEDFEDLFTKSKSLFDRRRKIAHSKVMPFRLRVQSKVEKQSSFDPSRPYTTCTASYLKLNGKCHLFTNEHCVQSKPAYLSLDLPEFSQEPVEVFEGKVATEWDMMTLEVPFTIESKYCAQLDDQNFERLNFLAHNSPDAYYSLGYSGRSGEPNMDIFSSQVDRADLLKESPKRGSQRSSVNLEFQSGKASRYNYIPVYRGMSGGVLTDEDGSPLCLIHRTVPQQDNPQCVDLRQMEEFVSGKLPRATPQDRMLFPELFQRTYERFNVSEQFENKVRTGNTTIPPGNSHISPGNSNIPPGNSNIPPGNSNIPPGNSNIPPGNSLIPPGMKFQTKGNPLLGLGDTALTRCLEKLQASHAGGERLKEFIEVLEGIVDYKDDENRELLAVRCGPFSPWEQIDGREDYIHKLRPYNRALGGEICPTVESLKETDKIYRDKDGYVPEEFRRDILKRLKGVYLTQKDKPIGLLANYSAPNGENLLTAKDRTSVHQRVEVDPEKEEISLVLGGAAGFIGNQNELATTFKVGFSEDGKKLSLTPKFQTGRISQNQLVGEMTCENKNFLKLICRGENTAFSLSLPQNRPRRMAIRFSSVNESNGEMVHSHGELHEND